MNNNPHHISGWKIALIAIAVVALLVAVGLAGYLPRRAQEAAAVQAANEERSGVPVVTAARVMRAPVDTELSLPGSISATAEAAIYARATGYVKKRMVDIGERVTTGQILAELETPELDQQVTQLRAGVAQAKQQVTQVEAAITQAETQRDLAKITFERYDALLKKGAIARQDADQQESAYKTAAALVSAQQAAMRAGEENIRQAQANLDRMIALQDYKNVRSPVDGVVTVRNIDTGYLISTSGAAQGNGPLDVPGGQNSSTGNEMYRVAQVGTVRILVNVPQASSPGIMTGMPVRVTVNEFQGRVFAGRVSRIASTLDPASRTMQIQIDIPNGDGKLIPGMYAQAFLQIHREAPPLLVPGDAVVAGADGTKVAILLEATGGTEAGGKQGARKIHLQTVQLGRDYGAQTEILGGLDGSETVVVNPGDEVREGSLVRAEVRVK